MNFKKHKQYRLPEFDYFSNNGYFITVCTKDRMHFFGQIENEAMYFTEIGLKVEKLFKSVIGKLEHLKIHEFVVNAKSHSFHRCNLQSKS